MPIKQKYITTTIHQVQPTTKTQSRKARMNAPAARCSRSPLCATSPLASSIPLLAAGPGGGCSEHDDLPSITIIHSNSTACALILISAGNDTEQTLANNI